MSHPLSVIFSQQRFHRNRNHSTNQYIDIKLIWLSALQTAKKRKKEATLTLYHFDPHSIRIAEPTISLFEFRANSFVYFMAFVVFILILFYRFDFVC